MLGKHHFCLKLTQLFLLVCFFVPTIKATNFQDRVIKVSDCQPWTIPCRIKNLKDAKRAILKINNTQLQGIDFKKNTIHCNNNHEFAKECQVQMNDSQLIGDLMAFVINHPWLALNQSVVHCHVRYDGHDDDHSPGKKILLRQCPVGNSSTIKPSIPTTSVPHTPVTNNATGKPNITKDPDNAPDERGNSDVITVKKSEYAVMVFFLVLFIVISLGFFIYICKLKKWYEKLPGCHHDEENGNDPPEEESEEMHKVDSSNGQV